MSRLCIPAVAALTMVVAWAHDPITTKLTWAREISRVFVRRCMSCHQGGGSAPFALSSYQDARPWAVAIREEVSNRTMPPWGAVKGFGEFKDDPSLTQEEISLIIDWVNGGAPEGDPALAPKSLPNAYAPPAASGRRLVVRGQLQLPGAVRIAGLRPAAAGDLAEAQVTAVLPDGVVEPLLWLRNWKAKFAHSFVLRDPLDAPAGTTIRVVANSPGPTPTVWLFVAPPRKAAQSRAPDHP